jgi:hypothetical protein
VLGTALPVVKPTKWSSAKSIGLACPHETGHLSFCSDTCTPAPPFLTGPSAGARFSSLREEHQVHRLSTPKRRRSFVDHSRRKFLLQYCQGISLAFLPADLGWPSFGSFLFQETLPRSGEFHVQPEYRAQRGLEAVLKNVQAGLDDFIMEKYQDQVADILTEWSSELLESPQKTTALEKVMNPNFLGTSPKARVSLPVRAGSTLKVSQMKLTGEALLEREVFLEEWRSSMISFSKIITAEFQVTSIRTGAPSLSSRGLPGWLETRVRFELVGKGADYYREQRVGNWELDWETVPSGEFRLCKWRMLDEMRSRSFAPVFIDVASEAFGSNPSYASQLLHCISVTPRNGPLANGARRSVRH